MVSVVETIEKPVISNETNINATINLLEATRKWDSQIKKFIFASSAAVYGDLPDLPKSTINSKVAPLSLMRYKIFWRTVRSHLSSSL